MSLRLPAAAYRRQPHEAHYTPGHVTETLLEALPLFRLGGYEAWEPAAGAGHVARVLAAHGWQVLATDLHPPARCVVPVAPLDFLTSAGPSGSHPLAIVTNPPYGPQSRLALAFLAHALGLANRRGGLVALLLPFEFDAAGSRHELVGGHPAFAAKLTVARRIRWLNLPQKKAGPMGHHSWFLWSFDPALRAAIRAAGMLRTL